MIFSSLLQGVFQKNHLIRLHTIVKAYNSLDVTESENVFLKGKFLCEGILIKIENFVWKLEKCPTFGPFYLITILYFC